MTDRSDSILRHGDPLGFRIRIGSRRPAVVLGAVPGGFRVEARAAEAQQKEGVLHEGAAGSVWRLTADEGAALNGHDIAPFPLAYLIAGVAGDLYNRLAAAAGRRGVRLEDVGIGMSHTFGSSGSFIQSTATASSEAAAIDISLSAGIDVAVARSLAKEAIDASPAVAFLREPVADNTFALHINGRRRLALGRPGSSREDVEDPFLTHASPPRPAAGGDAGAPILAKPGIAEGGDAPQVPLASPGKRLFTIAGRGSAIGDGRFMTETWIARPGMSHFRILSDESAADAAPSGLGLLSTGIAFCFLTQLHRYVEAQKLAIRAPRLVQLTEFAAGSSARAGAVDTHLFLNGSAPDDMHENLLNMAARTCFMHAAAAARIEPSISLRLNGEPVA